MFRIKRILLITYFLFVQLNVKAGHLGSVIPYPSHIQLTGGYFEFKADQKWYAESIEQQKLIVDFLKTQDIPHNAIILHHPYSGIESGIVLRTNKTLNPESYKLIIGSDKISIEAFDDSGFFYALQTIRQLLPLESVDLKVEKEIIRKIPALILEDSPRFEYRGLMLDVARYFIPKENVMKLIDIMGQLKLNKLHLHLVDDNGWRIEIKKHPGLTEIGAWRVDRKEDFPGRRNPEKGELTPVGGFYTQEDIKEIVKYASDRMVEVIPEIEMPAHTNSSLAAYPHLACPVVDEFIGVIPGLGGPKARIIYCAGNNDVFQFIEEVLNEIIELFPSQYVHLGGDEAQKYFWEMCPLCQKRMKDEGLKNEEDLQGYFMKRVSAYLKSKGKISMGWDEVTNSDIPEDMVVLGWQGLGTAAVSAAKLGHKFIMAPARKLYFIRYQGPQWFEPYTYFGNNTLKDVYFYDPVQLDWKEECKNLLMGVQGCMWTEFCSSPEDVEYQIFPRLLALSEIGWTRPDNKNWESFIVRTDEFLKRLDRENITYAKSMFNLDHLVKSQNNELAVSLSTERPDLEIRCTIDGNEPSFNSALYRSDLSVSSSTLVKAATFKKEEKMGKTLTLNIQWNKATGKEVSGDLDNSFVLTNGIRGSERHSDFEWAGLYERDGSFIIDLNQQMLVNSVVLGTLTNYSMGVHKPKQITLSVSSDNISYKILKIIKFSPKEIFRDVIEVENINFGKLSTEGRYLKVEFKNPGLSPESNVRAGTPNWVYFDEIIVN